MLSQPFSVTFNSSDNQTITIETGKLARQADGAVTVRQGNCIVLATVVATKEPKEGQEFFPLSVDYQEKFASAGRIPGSFFKREARLNDYEILTSRLVDRALRPLFPEDYFCDVQVLINLISSDPEVMPDALACLAASAALAVSDIPIKEIISEVRISRVNGKMVVNPTRTELEKADLEFIIAATEKNLMMVEGEASECSEEDLIQALQLAHDAIRIQIKAQEELRAKVGAQGKRDYKKPETNDELQQKVNAFAKDRVYQVSRAGSSKHERSQGYDQIKEELIASLGEEISDTDKKLAKKYYEDLKWEVVRNMILDESVRLDG
ncbi:MAG TPA: polyribonucleotide nucleotidyltransferase, partial [Puia sp.]|nr:polyribonucleotide nucleotidyltransferase [Puia sp.]